MSNDDRPLPSRRRKRTAKQVKDRAVVLHRHVAAQRRGADGVTPLAPGRFAIEAGVGNKRKARSA